MAGRFMEATAHVPENVVEEPNIAIDHVAIQALHMEERIVREAIVNLQRAALMNAQVILHAT